MDDAQGWAEEAVVGKADPPISERLRVPEDMLPLEPASRQGLFMGNL